MNKLAIFLLGTLFGGVGGSIAGYVINDLTSKENPEVMQEIRAEEAQQDEFEDFLRGLEAETPLGPGNQPTAPAPDEGAASLNDLE